MFLFFGRRLNEKDLIQTVLEKTPLDELDLTVQSVPLPYLQNFLAFLAAQLEHTHHLGVFACVLKFSREG